MKFKLEYIMNVDDTELVDVINEQNNTTYNSIDEIPDEKLIDAIYENDYIDCEIDYNMLVDNIKVTPIRK